MFAFKVGQIYELKDNFKSFDSKVYPAIVYINGIFRPWHPVNEPEQYDIRFCAINDYIGRRISLKKFDLYYQYIDDGKLTLIQGFEIGDLTFAVSDDGFNSTLILTRKKVQ